MRYQYIDGKPCVVFDEDVGIAMYKSAHYLALLETAKEINPSQATEDRYYSWLSEHFGDEDYYDDDYDEDEDNT